MVDRIDLLIAVVGIVVSVVGSSTALWVVLAKKPDREDLGRLETRFEADLGRLETRFEADLNRIETKLEADFNRVENKLDGLILRLVPEGRS